jgi:hypothetical protein
MAVRGILTTERLWLVPLTRRLMLERLRHNDFRTIVGTPEPREVHVGPEWPGDPLPGTAWSGEDGDLIAWSVTR